MSKDNYRKKFFGKHTKRLYSDYELFLEKQNQEKDKVIEEQNELLSECVEFLYNDDLIDRISKRQ